MTDINKYRAEFVDGVLKRWELKLKRYVEVDQEPRNARYENVSIVKNQSETSLNLETLDKILEQLKIINVHLALLTEANVRA